MGKGGHGHSHGHSHGGHSRRPQSCNGSFACSWSPSYYCFAWNILSSNVSSQNNKLSFVAQNGLFAQCSCIFWWECEKDRGSSDYVRKPVVHDYILIIFCVMCVGLSFIVAFAVNPESYLVGLISFGSIIFVYSSIFAIITVKKCCQVGSLRYFMCPCLMSQIEIDQLKNKCQIKHDQIFGTKVEQTDNQVLDVANQNDQGLSDEGNELEDKDAQNDEKQNEVFKEPVEHKPVQAELVFSVVM
ncbi:Hypothetical_protein [Hexamita inflata]|uniref:Hypothetical_protein n=1 Tax=Hexamita inflata TaxID=28002 RepID=A0AA86U2R3_9EUKA|nr:Hypothetical protein HINF_LOCUS27570 [Hexamita inflata]